MAIAAQIAMVKKLEDSVVRNLELAEREGRKVKDPRENNPNFDQWVKTNKETGAPGKLIESKAGKQPGCSPVVKSQIEAFVYSPECRDWGKSGSGKTFEAQIPELVGPDSRKAAGIVTISDLRDQMTTQRLQGVVQLPVRANRIRSLMPNYPTVNSAVKHVVETGFSNAAAGRPENIDPDSTTGASQSGLTTVVKTANVETVDHYLPIPIELFDDAPALVAFMEGRLEDGLDDNEDAMCISGAGPSSNEMLGFLTDTDVPSVLWSEGDVGDNEADGILNAMVALWLAEYEPERTVLNPARWASIVKAKDNNGQYLIPQAHVQKADLMLWGYPTTKTTAIAANKALVGAFSRAAAIWDRLRLRFRMTDSHEGHFEDGIIFVLAMRRAALTKFRPESFRKFTFDNPPV